MSKQTPSGATFLAMRISTVLNNIMSPNKKVLLRERKRHTARRVSSAPRYAGGGVPGPRSGGGTLSQVRGGVTHPDLQTWSGGGVLGPEMGYPPPPQLLFVP